MAIRVARAATLSPELFSPYAAPPPGGIEVEYVKRLRAKMLQPAKLRYVDRSDGQERVIGSDKVPAVGETDAEFRSGIVMSDEGLRHR